MKPTEAKLAEWVIWWEFKGCKNYRYYRCADAQHARTVADSELGNRHDYKNASVRLYMEMEKLWPNRFATIGA